MEVETTMFTKRYAVVAGAAVAGVLAAFARVRLFFVDAERGLWEPLGASGSGTRKRC